MQKSTPSRAQKQKKPVKQQKAKKAVQKVAKRTMTKQSRQPLNQQSMSVAKIAPVVSARKQQSMSKLPSMGLIAAPTKANFKMTPLQTLSKRNMSVLVGTRVRTMVPCDPRFQDDEVIAMFNPKTNMIEPVIVAVPEISFEWIFSSPCDLHTFDVIPVVKDCIDPSNPVFESMDA